MKRARSETIQYFIILAVCAAVYAVTGKTAAGIVAAVMAVYAVFAAAVTLLSGRRTTVQLKAPKELKKNSAAPVSVSLKNESAFPVFRCGTELMIRNLLTGEETSETVSGGILPKRSVTLSADAGSSVCGMLQIRTLGTEVSDPLGIFRRRTKSAEVSAETLLVPQLMPVDITPEELERYDMESFKFAEGKTGADTSETVGIRDYVPGDNIRSIHWKLSVKAGDIVIKEPGLPVDNRLMILADKKIPEEGISPEEIDRLTEGSLSVSWSILERDLKHSFGWYDRDRNEFVVKQITTADDIFALMPEFLSSPWAEDQLDVCERYISSETEKNYASYLVISKDGENCAEGADKLKNYGYVAVFKPEERK